MKLSVITICKNEYTFIKETCESIVGQTFQDFEWIVIDGGSTDGSLNVFNDYKNRINYFISEQDNGIYNAMNKGINQADGEFVLFLNGGDLFYDKFVLEKSLNLLDDSADIFYGDSFRLFSEKEKCYIKIYPDIINKEFFLTNTLGHQSCFIRKELFNKYSGYIETFRIVSDKEKWLEFYDKKSRFKHIKFPVSKYRMNGISQNKTPELLHEKEIMFRMHNLI